MKPRERSHPLVEREPELASSSKAVLYWQGLQMGTLVNLPIPLTLSLPVWEMVL